MRYLLLLALVSAMVSLLGCSPQEDIYSRPDEELGAAAKLRYEPDTARYSDSAIMIELSYLNPRNLDTYFRLFKDGKYPNPFAPKSHMVFSVTIENRSEGVLNYNPRLTMLLTENDAPILPKDFTDLYTDLEIVKAGDTDMRMRSFKAACFDNSIIIQPGERIQRLLVFPRREEAKRGGTFLFGSIYLDYKSRDIPIDFNGDLTVDD